MGINKEQILQDITHYYLGSGDFNGISAVALIRKYDADRVELMSIMKDLIGEDKVGVIYSDTDINTHIIRIGFEPREIQVAKLDAIDVHTCLYPRRSHLGLAEK